MTGRQAYHLTRQRKTEIKTQLFRSGSGCQNPRVVLSDEPKAETEWHNGERTRKRWEGGEQSQASEVGNK